MEEKLVKDRIKKFYNQTGWVVDSQGHTKDACLNEDLRDVAKDYVSKCRKRINRYLPTSGDKILDMASGPVQYDEYLTYSNNFNKRYCVDLSELALSQAKEKLKDRGEYYCGDFLELEFNENFFDCTISCHTIYHIQEALQEQAVRKLLRITKTEHPVIIIYSNPKMLINFFIKPLKILKRVLCKNRNRNSVRDEGFYFHSHPLSFWKRFEDTAEVKLYPWRSFSAKHQKLMFPNNVVGKLAFRLLFKFEDYFSSFFIRHFKFYTVVLMKKGRHE